MGKPIFDNISKSMKNIYCFDHHNSKGSSLYKFTDTKKIFEIDRGKKWYTYFNAWWR